MGLETGTYVTDLVTTNPLNADLESQGAAHIRLIKSVLQSTFPGASRPVGVPRISSKVANFSPAQTDAMTTYLVDTTAGVVTMTLPTLASSDAGWEIQLIKTNTGTSPILIAPPSGTLSSGPITGLAATRRCIPNTPTRVIWTGSAFICTRALDTPVGACLEYHGSSLPVGFEWPNGQTLAIASTNYPDFYSINGSSGVTKDKRQRIAAGSSLGGADPARITTAASSIDGTTAFSTGGAQTVDLIQSDLPNINQTVTISDTGHTHSYANVTFSNMNESAGGQPTGTGTGSGTTGSNSALNITANCRINGNVTQTHVNKMPPTIIVNQLLVVE